VKTTKKASVKKATDKKEVVKKGIVPVVKNVGRYTYKNISNITLNEPKKIKEFLKKEEKRLLDRMIERKINFTDIHKLTKYIQHQFLDGKNTFISVKYIFVLNNDKKQLIHFGKKIK
jgi:predicted transcriptional regulator